MRFRPRFYIASAILILGVFFVQHFPRGEAIPVRRSLKDFPLTIGEWQGKEVGLDPRIKEILRVEDSIMRVYSDGGQQIWFYVGYFQRADFVHSPKVCYPGSGWYAVETGLQGIEIPAYGQDIVVNKYLIQKRLEKQLVLYWYQGRGRITAKEYLLSIYFVLDAIIKNRTDGALVRISAPITPEGVDATLQREIAFIKLAMPILSEFLPE